MSEFKVVHNVVCSVELEASPSSPKVTQKNACFYLIEVGFCTGSPEQDTGILEHPGAAMMISISNGKMVLPAYLFITLDT